MTDALRKAAPCWLIFEGRAYRLSDDMPDSPPWTHVERARESATPEREAKP